MTPRPRTRAPASAGPERGEAGLPEQRAGTRHGPNFEQRVLGALAALIPGYPETPLCVAFSGGLDSTALLTVLAGTPALAGRLRALHVNHGLSAQAPRWAAHCRRVARQLGVPLATLRARVPRGKDSLEAAAREVRYRLLGEHLAAGEVLITAQHADDQLETVLLQLLRGAGLPGIAGMPALTHFAAGQLARPLLSFSRSEIERWARARKLAWCEDETNADERFDRNYLRRRILPLIRARWPGAAQACARTARHAAEAQRLLDLMARADVERCADGAALAVPRLRALDMDRRRNALRYWIARSQHPLPDARRLAELAGPLIRARADANPLVQWNGTVAERSGTRLTLRRAAVWAPLAGLEWTPRSCPVLELPARLGRLELAADRHGPIDAQVLPDRLLVRLRRGGERLAPRRGGPRRALKSLMQEARIAPRERGSIPLVFAGEELLAVGDLWTDARIQAGARSAQRARLIWHRA